MPEDKQWPEGKATDQKRQLPDGKAIGRKIRQMPERLLEAIHQQEDKILQGEGCNVRTLGL